MLAETGCLLVVWGAIIAFVLLVASKGAVSDKA